MNHCLFFTVLVCFIPLGFKIKNKFKEGKLYWGSLEVWKFSTHY